jgi:hypothetical protein
VVLEEERTRITRKAELSECTLIVVTANRALPSTARAGDDEYSCVDSSYGDDLENKDEQV